jgi:argininosuccinate lyase
VNQDPLGAIKRRQRRQRGSFPDAAYERDWLAPAMERAEATLTAALIDVYRAHAVMLAEQRILEAEPASRILGALVDVQPVREVLPQHALRRVEAAVARAEGGDLLRGMSREEAAVAAMRIVLRQRLLDLHDGLLDLRDAVAGLAAGHLTTLMVATAHGQIVQPTTLGHYLTGQLAPLVRACTRLQEAWPRVNQSPVGAGSGMSTALPIRRGRVSELLGFDAVIDSTFDALAAHDVFTEVGSHVAVLAIEVSRLVADMQHWSRDDVGLLIPGDEYLHAGTSQPQRRDPAVLDHLRVELAALAAMPGHLAVLLSGSQMLGTEQTRQRAFEVVDDALANAAKVGRLLAAVLRSAVVNRAMLAHRTNRGFATSSELADLLTVDYKLPRAQAYALAEQIVIEATEAGGEATTLKPELIDSIALRTIGRELGIEPELLARCLAPKRFVERRDATGAPAPHAVSAALDRETFSARRDGSWLSDRRARLDTARHVLHARAEEIARDPATARKPALPPS